LILNDNFAQSVAEKEGGIELAHHPVVIMAYRFRQLVPERPKLEHFERWYAAIAARPAFKQHVSSIPLQ
jgi:glutathione S-transferase